MNDSSEAVPNGAEKKKKHRSPGTPKSGIREGLRRFAEWYKEYYRAGP